MKSDLISLSINLRKRIIETSSKAKIPHLGSCLSCIDLLIYLYWEELEIDTNNPNNKDRDRFILSKGHGAPALFQVLAEKNFFPIDDLKSFGKPGSYFHEHPPKPGLIPGVEAATGSLGHGLSMALGMAYASSLKKRNYRTFVMLSDGECNEGTVWEAALLAPNLNINKLTVIIDFNKWQATGRSEEITKLQPLFQKWKSFGWDVYEINGHDFNDIKRGFDLSRNCTNKPSVIIANTVKGKGISFMEDNNNWHYRIPNEEELQSALRELN
tara:strand:- start:487 stop:1296 length:810 start_codon:yes stop_codon:yes gene_type:complete